MTNKNSKCKSQRQKKVETQSLNPSLQDSEVIEVINDDLNFDINTELNENPPQNNFDEEELNQFLNRVYCRVRQIKENNPDVSAEIDMNERLVSLHFRAIKEAINKLPSENKELVTILVVSGIRGMIEELLDIKHDEIKDSDARNIDMHKTRKLRKKDN